ncbi:MAG: hypothetical protein AAFU71_12880 [Cyanobacteria bacterium J06632_22]
MTPDDQPPALDLLVPWDIPVEYRLSDAEKIILEESLRRLLKALQAPKPELAQQQIEQILAELAQPTPQAAQIISTKTFLNLDDVGDYDRYFGVNHIQTKDITLCLVRGLLVTCQRFMVLWHQTPQLDPHRVSQQIQGFISYVHLLARTFSLDSL